jgi:hypothetical protein
MNVFTREQGTCKLLGALVLVLMLTGCNPQEFYEKTFLAGLEQEETDLQDPRGEILDPVGDIADTPDRDHEQDSDAGVDDSANDDHVADNDQGDDQGNDNNDDGDTAGDDHVADNDQGDDQGNDNNDDGDTTGDDHVADNDQGDDQGNDSNDDGDTTGDDHVADNDQGDDQGNNNDNPVCDPFGGNATDNRHGIRASLYDGLGNAFTRVNQFYTQGHRVSDNLYFSTLNVPTRRFNQGFLNSEGVPLAGVDGSALHEWFALQFQGRLTLADDQEAGLYELALLADDGVVLSVGPNHENLQTLIAADYHTATRMSCASRLVQMSHQQALAFKLDYFQGPREHIALVMLWRRVSDPSTHALDSLCNRTGQSLFFNSATTPSTPQTAYHDLMGRGFQVVGAENFLLPTDTERNPCVADQVIDVVEEVAQEDHQGNDGEDQGTVVIDNSQDQGQEEDQGSETSEVVADNTEDEEGSSEDGVEVGQNDGGNDNDADTGREVAQEAIEADEEQLPADPALTLVSDRFVQDRSSAKPVDILWVMDDSGSMANDQNRLARNFEAFIHEFLNRDLDFQMAITTTDGTPRGDGKWNGNYIHLDTNAAQKNETKFIRDFQRTINVGTRGSPVEMGLHTSLRFLQRYHNRKPMPFVRDDAYLVIIYISDEEDQSPLSVEHYINSITNFKDSASMVKIYSIVTDKFIMNQWETVGHRYMKAADMVGGVKADIKEDFYPILRDMGLSIANLTESFALNQRPYNDQIEVLVDGEKVTTGYTYDHQTRSVRFDDNALPREGAEVEVRYMTLSVETK